MKKLPLITRPFTMLALSALVLLVGMSGVPDKHGYWKMQNQVDSIVLHGVQMLIMTDPAVHCDDLDASFPDRIQDITIKSRKYIAAITRWLSNVAPKSYDLGGAIDARYKLFLFRDGIKTDSFCCSQAGYIFGRNECRVLPNDSLFNLVSCFFYYGKETDMNCRRLCD